MDCTAEATTHFLPQSLGNQNDVDIVQANLPKPNKEAGRKPPSPNAINTKL